jgi:hypothetical protein
MVLAALSFVAFTPLFGQTFFKHPPAGSIYKDFSRAMMLYRDWRVIDPNTQRADAQSYLPNTVLSLNIDDLSGATRAEAIIDFWQGHWGTTNKRIRFNGHTWITIPELTAPPTDGQCYGSSVTMVVDVPLSHLQEGNNSFEGTTGGQTCYDFDWGQWGQFGIIVRVYYGSSKAHASGSITSPSNGATLGSSPSISVSASGGAGVDRVEVFAYYDGYDVDGDGVYKDWQYHYHRAKDDNFMETKGHVGTDFSSPYQVTWNTDIVPDQSSGSVKLQARIRDNNGVWYVTNEVTGLSLNRSSSLKLYKASGVPERFAVRSGRDTRTCTINIPDDPSSATQARLLVTTWNGINYQAEPGETGYTKINSHTFSLYGEREHWSFDVVGFPVSRLNSGSNTFTVYSNSSGFGISINWPGPAVLLTYGSPVPIQLASFAGYALASGGVHLTWRTQSETNNFGFEVQKALGVPENFATIANSFIPGHGTTVQPQDYQFTDSSAAAGVWYYRLKQIDLDGTVNYHDPIRVDVGSVTSVTEEAVPTVFTLDQNYPNPFNPSTTIRYGLPQGDYVKIVVYDMLGREVARVLEGPQTAGFHEITFEAGDLPSGTYVYRLETPAQTLAKKLVLVK